MYFRAAGPRGYRQAWRVWTDRELHRFILVTAVSEFTAAFITSGETDYGGAFERVSAAGSVTSRRAPSRANWKYCGYTLPDAPSAKLRSNCASASRMKPRIFNDGGPPHSTARRWAAGPTVFGALA